MTFYLFLADRHGTGSGARWALMGIAVKVAQSVSFLRALCSEHILTERIPARLDSVSYASDVYFEMSSLTFSYLPDRDSGRWQGVDPVETQRRRELFWELFTYDSWQCLTFGRPPSFALPHFDCKMPHAKDPSDEQSCMPPIFYSVSSPIEAVLVCRSFLETSLYIGMHEPAA